MIAIAKTIAVPLNLSDESESNLNTNSSNCSSNSKGSMTDDFCSSSFSPSLDIVSSRLAKAVLHGTLVLRRGEGVADTESGAALHALCAYAPYYPGGAAALMELAVFAITSTSTSTNAASDHDLSVSKAALNIGDSEGDSPMAHARYFRSAVLYDVLHSAGGGVTGPFFQQFGHLGGRGG